MTFHLSAIIAIVRWIGQANLVSYVISRPRYRLGYCCTDKTLLPFRPLRAYNEQAGAAPTQGGWPGNGRKSPTEPQERHSSVWTSPRPIPVAHAPNWPAWSCWPEPPTRPGRTTQARPASTTSAAVWTSTFLHF